MATESTNRGIVRYTSRDYESIMKDFWDIVPTLTELWSPEAESDPGVVLSKFVASAADMLGVNLDWLANEIFGPSVSQRKNAQKLFALIGYELGWYTAARTEVTFKNVSDNAFFVDFGFNGRNFCTLNAYSDITGQSRTITYNVLPHTSQMGPKDSRSRRDITTSALDIFASSDKVLLQPGEEVVRVAIEGELRENSYSVETIKKNNYRIKLSSQHVDTTAIWIKGYNSRGQADDVQWVQCASVAEFVAPEPRFAVVYDSYSNAEIQISSYLDDLENYESTILKVYWIDCSGVIGCVAANVLTNLVFAKSEQGANATDGALVVTNLSNTDEKPNTYTVTGKSPETAKEAYFNSRNYINTFDSLVTLPDFNRFLRREPGVDCGTVLDCQKALEINIEIYKDENLTSLQKSKKFLTNFDFSKPVEDLSFNVSDILGFKFDSEDPLRFATDFKQYTAMCYAIHNNFQDSAWGKPETSKATWYNGVQYTRYRPPMEFIAAVKRDYMPLQTMTVELEFGFIRVFDFHVTGTIYPITTLDKNTAAELVTKVKETLSLYFSPANRELGVAPTIIEIAEVVRKCDSRINYFDIGTPRNTGIVYDKCDPDYFNPISFARYVSRDSEKDIRVCSEYISNY